MTSETPLEFLQRKWRMWFKVLDLNNDKVLSRDDYKTCIANIKDYFKDRISDDMLEELRRGYDIFWEDVLFGKLLDKESFSEDELVVRLTKLYSTDKSNFHRLVRQMAENVVTYGDIDGNGRISFQEYQLLFAAFSTKDPVFLRRMFNYFSPSPQDEIPYRPYIDQWVDFVIGEDPTKENFLIKAYNDNKPDNTVKPLETPLAFLHRKWRMWYKLLDQNKDGMFSTEDYKTCIASFENYYRDRVDAKVLEEMRRGYEVFWGELGGMLQRDTMTEDELIATMTELYSTDKNRLNETVSKMTESVIKVSDLDKNGMISFEEYVLMFSAFQTTDRTFLRQMFDDHGPSSKDEISLTQILDTWVDFVTGTDPSKDNIALNANLRLNKPQDAST